MEEKHTILIVEDERIVADDIQRCLENFGYQVCDVVSSGQEALKVIKKFAPDLVLMDIVLRGNMNGIDTAERIRTHFNMPVIYLTAYADKKMLQRAKVTEPYGYIIKPIDDKELESTIEIALYKHKMEQKLIENEAWFSTTLSSIGDGIITTDKSGYVKFMNPASEHLTGWQQDEVIGKPLNLFLKIIDEDSRKMIRNPVINVLSNRKTINRIHHSILINKEGREISVDINSAAINNKRGNVIGVVLVLHDITERKKSEQALLKSEKEKQLILSSVSELVVYLNTKFEIIWANKAAADSAGMSSDELVGCQCHQILNMQESLCDYCPVRDVLKLKMPCEAELSTLDGMVWHIRGYPVRDENENIIGIVEVARDITERKRIEAEKEEIQAQLLQSQKMEALGTLTGGVAHDFNNLLTAIQGCADMAVNRVDKNNPIYQDLRDVQIASMRAADLTHQLLLFSRKSPIKLTVLIINNILVDLLKMLQRLIGENIIINTQLEPDLWAVRTNQGTMSQIILNLVVNAKDSMPRGGNLTIKTENVLLDDTNSKNIPDARTGQFVRLTISDSGKGMHKEILQHIFEPFFSTKTIGDNSGLGLSVVYGIVKQNNGWIVVTSEPQHGSRFEIYLPAVKKKKSNKIKDEFSIEDLQGHGERILIVEDAEVVLEFAALALSENGYIPTMASNVVSALNIFKKEKGNFDLLFSDMVLPDKSAIELIDELLQIKPDLKILLSSGYSEYSLHKSFNYKDDIHFLNKPYSLVHLLKSVKEVLEEVYDEMKIVE
jgi:PAS domain S-box-containing protein